MAPTTRKRLFLVDAMGYIFRAYFAPMDRLQTSTGIPTKVPYLFATMMRRLLSNKDRRPDYVAVVFDVAAPTFRDKLFADYKAQRPPMPDDLAVQLPFVRRYCEAMRLPILEYPGYEADDVIGTLSRLAAKRDLETFIVTSDKDLMQLVNKDVTVLNPAKGDLLVDEKKVEELMGVPPAQVADVMALMGDSIDNIPGARDPNDKPAPGERRKAGIGDVGARQLIQQFGSAEEALKRASEVKRSSYREALQNCGKFVMLSKQLATIPTDAPVPLDLPTLQMGEPDSAALRELYAELGLHFPAARTRAGRRRTKNRLRAARFAVHAGEILARNSTRPRSRARGFRSTRRIPTKKASARAFSRVEISTKAGQARIAANDVEDKSLAAMKEWLADPKRPKIVHDPKLFQLLTMGDSDRDGASAAASGRSPGFATPRCCIPFCCGPPRRITSSPKSSCAI